MPLDPHDERHITAADGYVELGMFDDANGERGQVAQEMRHASEVLAISAAPR